MDPHRPPPPPPKDDAFDDDLRAAPGLAAPIGQGPPTPGAMSDTASNYFESAPGATLAPAAPSVTRLTTNSSVGTGPFGRVPSNSDRPLDRFRRREPSIRIRRSSNTSLRSSAASTAGTEQFPDFDGGYVGGPDDFSSGNRPRSISQPERAHVSDAAPARHSRRVPQVALPRLTEEGARPTLEELGVSGSAPVSPTRSLPDMDELEEEQQQPARGRKRTIGRNMMSMLWPGQKREEGQQTRRRGGTAPSAYMTPEQQQELAQRQRDEEYASELVDWLDIIDPEVQTLSTLTNVQNSLFVPDLGHWINRRPTYTLSQHAPTVPGAVQQPPRPGRPASVAPTVPETIAETDPTPPQMQRSSTITSRLTESHYAALPHGTTLEGWTQEEKSELDDHVRHMLHSRRSRMKRRFKGFGQYVRRPLGFFVTLYATLITLFGLAWVLFLIGWIYVGDKQDYIIHIVDSVLVALFAIMGDGLAPFRAVDTYHMIFIARYTRIINNAKKGKFPRPRSRLQKRNMPPEVEEALSIHHASRQSTNKSPANMDGLLGQRDSATVEDPRSNTFSPTDPSPPADMEEGKYEYDDEEDMPGLTAKQRKSLEHHKKKLAKSHSFYKPKETFTHYAFPLDYLIAIVILLDCHSLLQISLGACTWGIDYHTRPFAITTVILCVSITCNVTAGLVITIGDRKTRKKDVVQLLDRQELTNDAIKLVEERRKKDQQSESGEDADAAGATSAAASTSYLAKEKRSEDGESKSSLRKLVKETSV